MKADGVSGLFRGAGPTVVRAMALNMGMLASNDQVTVFSCSDRAYTGFWDAGVLWSFECKLIDFVFHKAGTLRVKSCRTGVDSQIFVHRPGQVGVPSPARVE